MNIVNATGIILKGMMDANMILAWCNTGEINICYNIKQHSIPVYQVCDVLLVILQFHEMISHDYTFVSIVVFLF